MIKFCPRCHKEAYRLEEDGDNIKIIQGNKSVISLNKKSTVSMSIACPSGHPVRLEIKKTDG